MTNETKIQKLIAALEFYADKDSWTGYEEEDGFLWLNQFVPDGQDYENTVGTIMCAGKLARQVLAEISTPEPEKETDK